MKRNRESCFSEDDLEVAQSVIYSSYQLGQNCMENRKLLSITVL